MNSLLRNQLETWMKTNQVPVKYQGWVLSALDEASEDGRDFKSRADLFAEYFGGPDVDSYETEDQLVWENPQTVVNMILERYELDTLIGPETFGS